MHKIVPFNSYNSMYRKMITAVVIDNKIQMVQSNNIWSIKVMDEDECKKKNLIKGIYYEVNIISKADVILNIIHEENQEKVDIGIIKHITHSCRISGIYFPEECDFSVFHVGNMYYFLIRYYSQLQAVENNFNENMKKYDTKPEFRKYYDLVTQNKPFPRDFGKIAHELKTVYCPVCGEELLVAGKTRLETMNEHVGDPNGEVCLKHTLVCGNKFCPACVMEFGWDESEYEMYSLGVSCINEYINFKDGITGAINGWGHIHELEKKYEEEHSHKWRIGKLVIEAYLVPNPIKCKIGYKGKMGWTRWFGIGHAWSTIKYWKHTRDRKKMEQIKKGVIDKEIKQGIVKKEINKK